MEIVRTGNRFRDSIGWDFHKEWRTSFVRSVRLTLHWVGSSDLLQPFCEVAYWS